MKKFLINLDRSIDRLNQFQSQNTQLSDLERFAAVDGVTLSRDDAIEAGIIAHDLPYTMTALGCAISHMTLWRHAVKIDQPITIIEDDAVLAPDFDQQSAAIQFDLGSDWDFIMWGWCFDAYLTVDLIPGVSPARIKFFQDTMRRGIQKFRATRYERRPVKLLHGMGTPCYSISPRGAKRLIEFCTPIRPGVITFDGFGVSLPNLSLDRLLNAYYRKMQSYAVIPPLAIVENNKAHSTIERS